MSRNAYTKTGQTWCISWTEAQTTRELPDSNNDALTRKLFRVMYCANSTKENKNTKTIDNHNYNNTNMTG